VGSSASSEQIEKAYTSFSSKLQDGAYGISAEEREIQKIAINDAYRTLSNPILRQRYDQKMADAELTVLHGNGGASRSFFGLKSIALIGLIALTGLYFYNQNAKEREKLRIAHEHEVQMKAVQIAEDMQKQNARVQDVVLDRSSAYAETQQLRAQQQQFERDSLRAQQLEMQQRQLDFQQQQQQKRDEDNRQRQEQLRHQQQLQADKRLLQQMERDRYGKVITH
jgi:hypothetical protein